MKNRIFIPIFTILFVICTAGSGKVTNTGNDFTIRKSIKSNVLGSFDNFVDQLFKASQLEHSGMKKSIFRKALVGYLNIKNKQLLEDNSILSVIDYSKASTEKRLWILDLKEKKVLFHSLVAHGRKSGDNLAINFSNKLNSNMSSLGFYKTGKIYFGKHGKSLVLHGLDKNYNSNAEGRSVVIHAADYVCEDFIKTNGRLGRSHGCPAVSPEESEKIIQLLEGGSCLFIYHPDLKTARSEYLNEAAAVKYYSKQGNML
ncbi:murein L,D-transpeptidase catalytic domain family protein [Sporocytophaga myxococcoides]|uniref:murein L,D-transpeptidase catalytic domain family protein n=1 Tax=Sporocytophaga myxococcoides TaxID=153721 RepID=UPI0003FD0A2D|nr:murein L,D-transpeptidase catalytic domain family protein [Sporocytophaga myxococcoides]